MGKQCRKCNEFKSLDNFYNRKDSKDGKRNDCINCNNIYTKINGKIWYSNNKEEVLIKHKEYKKSKSNINYVYLLPDHNYVGTTNNIVNRMHHHRTISSRNTKEYRILYSSENRIDALEFEELLHDIGYEGRHPNNVYR
jgi:hypothetical protein